MSDKQIIEEAANQVGRQIGRLQGKLFVAETKAEALKAQIQRLDAVYQNFQAQLQQAPVSKPPILSTDEVIEILRDQLPVLDPASQPVCFDVIGLLTLKTDSPTQVRLAATARMESHAWKQGEAIALAQKVVQLYLLVRYQVNV